MKYVNAAVGRKVGIVILSSVYNIIYYKPVPLLEHCKTVLHCSADILM
jgi:hypothetical protein